MRSKMMMRRKKGGSEKRPVAPEAAVAMAVAMRSSHQLLRILPPGHQPAKAVASKKLLENWNLLKEATRNSKIQKAILVLQISELNTSKLILFLICMTNKNGLPS